MTDNSAAKGPDAPPDRPASAVALRTDRRLLEILVCPVTRGPLEYDAAAGVLISRQAGLAYPIRDGIPIMVVDDALPLADVAGSQR